MELVLGDGGDEGDVRLSFLCIFCAYITEFVSFVTYHSRTTTQGAHPVSPMERSFSGLAPTLKLSAGLTALPHSSMY